MTVRALIVALDEYSGVQAGGFLARDLPGSIAAAQRFEAWLRKKWAAQGIPSAEHDVTFCSSPSVQGGRSASREDLVKSLLELKDRGAGMTKEMFFFFSGHGFAFEGIPGYRSDAIVLGDFVSGAQSSHTCFRLDEIVGWLRAHLGPGHHFFFVDACRNLVPVSYVRIGDQLPWNPQSSEEATSYVVHSTTTGAPALVNGPFAAKLVEGLQGERRAKVWDDRVPDGMVVRYDSLRTQLKQELAGTQPISHRVEGPDGEGDAILSVLRPVPKHRLELSTSSAGKQFDADVRSRRNDQKWSQQGIVSSFQLELEPDRYDVRIQWQGPWAPGDRKDVDLFDDAVVAFSYPEDRLGPSVGLETVGSADSGPSETLLELRLPFGTKVTTRNISTGKIDQFEDAGIFKVPAGAYECRVMTLDDTLLDESFVDSAGKDRILLDPLSSNPRPAHLSIAAHFPGGLVSPEFSESIGHPVNDWDIGLWLALLGAGRIVGSRGEYSKLSKLPLVSFADLSADASAVYVLASVEDAAAQLHVALGNDSEPVWRLAEQPGDLDGVRHAVFETARGSSYLSLQLKGEEPVTQVCTTLPNRCTLVVVAETTEGPEVSQFLLPIGHLVPNLPDAVRVRLNGRNHLRDVMSLARLSRAFRRRKVLMREYRDQQLFDLTYLKWLDPVGSVMAAYELLRRGARDSEALYLLDAITGNLQDYFPEIPDTLPLTRLALAASLEHGSDRNRDKQLDHRLTLLERHAEQEGAAPPLFRDGLRSASIATRWLAWLSNETAEPGAMWTQWRGAVSRAE